ncbi:MAG TPA: flagellar hook-associated protein FlgL [Solirubrobacteraceae bacterium]|nr:flagellar hook-associated protein FlgL [Solirubrobacteraceae bacterium]
MTGRITDAMLTAATLNDLNSSLGALERSSAELSSGKTILQPSDNPYGASHAIDLQSQLDGLSSYTKSVQDGISWTQAASGAMSNIATVGQRVRELVLEASNGTNNATDLANIATEVKQLTETIKQDANTQFAGQYVFSGTATSTAPYAQGEGGADVYKGNHETIARLYGPNATVVVNTDLSTVLGSGKEAEDGKLLDVLRTISQHLTEATPASRAALGNTDLKALDTSLEGLSQLQSSIGSATNQLQTAISRIEALQASIEKGLSSTIDTDVAKTTIEYANQQAAYEAALRAGANIVQESLLNFLH